MKKKQLLIGITAMLISVASAAASSVLFPVQTYILARNSSTTPFTCVNLDDICDTDGIFSCQIMVITIAPPGTKTVSGRRINCATALTHTSNLPVNTGLTFYDVQ